MEKTSLKTRQLIELTIQLQVSLTFYLELTLYYYAIRDWLKRHTHCLDTVR